MIIQTGVDTSLDQYRLIYQSMTSILDECTVATKQNLLQSFPISSYFDTWGYEFLPRSCYSCWLSYSWLCFHYSNAEYWRIRSTNTFCFVMILISIINRHSSFPSDFQYQFHTEDCVYYKTDIAFQLDHVYFLLFC